MTYKITGKDVRGKRFKIYTTSRIHALGINLYQGTVWIEKENGKWKPIKRVNN
jgi:hypothetical protein|tara:strand:- start:228 stop:386 length:159 start_codon:yes stop_codon:yes gene_type:complete